MQKAPGTESKQPTLETERCILRPANDSDLDYVVAAVRSPQFPRQLPLAELDAGNKLSRWLEQMCHRSADGSAFLWSIDLRDGTCCIGQVTLAPKSESAAWSLAFWLHPEYWGRGLAVEAATAVLQFAFESLCVTEVWAGVAHWNHRSITTVERLGLCFVADDSAGYVIGGRSEAVREFRLTRQQWRDRQARNA